jgi:ribose 5-phosphate isomerase
LGFSTAAATYLTGTCGINSLDEIAYLDGIDDVDTTIKVVTNPGGTVTIGKVITEVTSRNNGIPFSIRAVTNLKLCVYYLKHMERVQRQPVANAINLFLIRSYRNQQRHEVGFKNTAEEPVINDKDWPRIGQELWRQSGSTLPPSME